MNTALDAPPEAVEAPPADLFSKHFCQLTFETHAWTGERTIAAVKATVKGEEVDATRARKPPVSLLPEDLRLKIRAARGGVGAVLDRHTIKCDEAGTRLLSVRHADAFVAEFQAAIAAFDAVADEVLARHDEILAHNRDYWAAKFATEAEYQREVGRLIPPRHRVRGLFSVHYRVVHGHGITARGLASTAAQAFFDEAAANAEAHRDALVESLVKEPVGRLAAALDALKDQLRDGTRITPGSFSNVEAAVSLCKACKDAIDPEVMGRILAVESQVGAVVAGAEAAKEKGGNYTASIRQYREALGLAIEGAVAACRDEALQSPALARYGTRRRGLILDPDPAEE